MIRTPTVRRAQGMFHCAKNAVSMDQRKGWRGVHGQDQKVSMILPTIPHSASERPPCKEDLEWNTFKLFRTTNKIGNLTIAHPAFDRTDHSACGIDAQTLDLYGFDLQKKATARSFFRLSRTSCSVMFSGIWWTKYYFSHITKIPLLQKNFPIETAGKK